VVTCKRKKSPATINPQSSLREGGTFGAPTLIKELNENGRNNSNGGKTKKVFEKTYPRKDLEGEGCTGECQWWGGGEKGGGKKFEKNVSKIKANRPPRGYLEKTGTRKSRGVQEG